MPDRRRASGTRCRTRCRPGSCAAYDRTQLLLTMSAMRRPAFVKGQLFDAEAFFSSARLSRVATNHHRGGLAWASPARTVIWRLSMGKNRSLSADCWLRPPGRGSSRFDRRVSRACDRIERREPLSTTGYWRARIRLTIFFAAADRLAMKDATLGLRDDPLDQRDDMAELGLPARRPSGPPFATTCAAA